MKSLRYAAALACAVLLNTSNVRAETPVEHGKYLVLVAGCTDCHTPGHFFGKPDMAHEFSGSEVGFFVPDLGTFYGPNLTSDKETGLGKWTDAQLIHTLRTGERPDGRILAPIMPWRAIGQFKESDVAAIVAYLRSLPPVSRKAPGPFGPAEQPTSFVFKILPPN